MGGSYSKPSEAESVPNAGSGGIAGMTNTGSSETDARSVKQYQAM